jgi:Coenzyme PQQ synthesis protein D (PqqD)
MARTDLICHEIDGEAVLYDAVYDVTYRFNATGYTIWKSCNGRRTIEDIAHQLADKYDVSREAAREDVSAAIDQMWRDGLLERREANAP